MNYEYTALTIPTAGFLNDEFPQANHATANGGIAFRSIFRLVEVLVIWMKDRCHSFGGSRSSPVMGPQNSTYRGNFTPVIYPFRRPLIGVISPHVYLTAFCAHLININAHRSALILITWKGLFFFGDLIPS